MVQAFGFFAQFGQFFADLDTFQPRQLTQADFKNVFGLNRRQIEVRHQIDFGVIRFANDLDHLVDIEEDGEPTFKDVNAFFRDRQPMAGAPGNSGQTEAAPFDDHAVERGLTRCAGDTEDRQIDRSVGFQTGVGEQQANQIVLTLTRRGRFDNQTHGVFLARFVTHAAFRNGREEGGFQVELFRREDFFAGFVLGDRVGAGFDFRHHRGGGNARRQFGNRQAPLATRQIFDFPARPNAQAAAAAAVDGGDLFGRGNDLRTAGIIRAWDQFKHLFFAEIRVFYQVDRSIGDFAQVVGRDLSRHADGDAGSAVEQAKRQAGREQGGFVVGAVVVRLPVDRAFVEFSEQQFGDRHQAGFGVAHCRSVIAIA